MGRGQVISEYDTWVEDRSFQNTICGTGHFRIRYVGRGQVISEYDMWVEDKSFQNTIRG